MKRPCRDFWIARKTMAVLLPTVLLAVGGCSGSPVSSSGPVRTEGVVTGKHRLDTQGNSEAQPRYFLWVKMKDGIAYVEVTEEIFRRAQEGEQVCIYCDPEGS